VTGLSTRFSPGPPDGFLVRVELRGVALRERIREKMSERVFVLSDAEPVFRRISVFETLAGLALDLLPEGSGLVVGLDGVGLEGRRLRMSRLEFTAGSRIPDEVLGLGAFGVLLRMLELRPETCRGDALEVRLVERGDLVGCEMRDDPLRLERLDVTVDRDGWADDRLDGRADGLAVVRVEELRVEVLREAELREDELGLLRAAALERLDVRTDDLGEGDLEDRLDVDGRSFASVGVVTSSTARQIRAAAKSVYRKDRKLRAFRLFELGRFMIGSLC